MSTCQAVISVDGSKKPIEVLFASGAEVSYISGDVASSLGLPMTSHEQPIVYESMVGGIRSSSSKTASINLSMSTLQETMEVLVVSGDFSQLVLGQIWFQKYNPSIDWRTGTFSIKPRHVIETTRSKQNSSSVFVPSMHIVRDTDPSIAKPKKSKNQIVKKGWGNRPNFQASYGLSTSSEDIEEGNRILEAIQDSDDEFEAC